MSQRINLAGLDRAAIADHVTALGARPFAAGQVFAWLHARRESDFANMSDLPRELRARLEAGFEASFPTPSERLTSADGATRFVFTLRDGERVESVHIPGDEAQTTLCLSSQVGCPLACTFCVSGLLGVKRNLTAAEMIGQARAMLPQRETEPRRINIVFMGMGEALLNFEALATTIAVLADPHGYNVSPRRMTVSTAGHVPALQRFATLPQRPRLAVSLNATTDALRDELMPVNRRWPLSQLLATCRELELARGERITFEYVLLAGVNDSPDDARRIPRLLAGIRAKVNLIPWNPAPGFPYEAPAAATVNRFAGIIAEHKIVVTVRRQRGADADAACGQLAVRRDSPIAAANP